MWYFSRSRAIEKNPNHSFYGKVVLTSHETSADSEAVNQFTIIEVCGDPLKSETFDVYSDTTFRLEQDLRKQHLNLLRTKFIKMNRYVGNRVNTEGLDFSCFHSQEDGNLQEINPNVDFARPTLRRRHDPTSDPCDAQLKRQKTEEEEMDENTRKSDRRG
ncbi:hypothetical protein B9Z55_027169 [Caenorhabditis nigoni]|uniref:Uncharacterized protein n=1 Tax=Caenorhabditis nigoni TaxID=1611254 RepID=A0A2G5SH31_9PELO|nr:hypothetical protein B9Z55_027169 [Caenorhabditis nigoni]